ncbi:uncharacterized protein LOC125177650 [Hyalella azteca]|uniref:Uncharacterized protein LOC125177650 n=1 Tax=Hyalella azteca TaxID=294128 RepID=A0A979FHG2_HYAAZ|nr:uncharacterized protein LOC125177650 [Hyalella azteca]
MTSQEADCRASGFAETFLAATSTGGTATNCHHLCRSINNLSSSETSKLWSRKEDLDVHVDSDDSGTVCHPESPVAELAEQYERSCTRTGSPCRPARRPSQSQGAAAAPAVM